VTTARPADQAARNRIRTDLASNMLVEAGAGSGKTTSLVERMLEHIRTGTSVDRLTAVTFTRKAANELRERFQVRLERAVRESPAASQEAQRYETALRELDRAFLGTIHSFCARLLRERPLEVGLDPSFQEISEDEWEDARVRFWRRWTERTRRHEPQTFAELRSIGIDPSVLYEGFKVVMTYPDVEFPVAASERPDTASCRRELEKLIVAARAAMPPVEPSAGFDKLMLLVRRMEFRRSVGHFDDTATFCDVLESISKSACEPTQNRWSDSKEGKLNAKTLGASWIALLEGSIADVLRCWREHRYAIVMPALQRASAAYARERYATGRLGFEDLLTLTARLLRENPAVRDELGPRYAYLLVDEFQDTDPIQAEVCFLLTSPSSEGTNWRTVVPRAGSLFVVGDPKQSIFRFRRADIQIYELVKRRMESFGVVLPLTANFRSVSSVEAVVNGHFAGVFPAIATPEQAPYSPMETRRDPTGPDGVFTYVVRPSGKRKDAIVELDADMVASTIAARVAAGERKAGDFMIITATKEPIACYARALAERNIPVSTTGARLPQEHELRELLVVLRAIADPENAIAVVAALEGLFFGVSPAGLWKARQRRIRFSVTHRPADERDAVARALLQLHEWWKSSQRHPADVLLERILDDSGLLAHAAAQPLGEARAGALLHLVESLRAASVVGASGLPDAMTRLETVLSAEAPDTPLRPGRTDAVRVMNLHKAKGLEAEVVFLAAPIDRTVFDPDVHIIREEDGHATGGICISYRDGNTSRVIAHPPHWAEMQGKEAVFQEAEKARLLYVAATRAKRELYVSQSEKPLVSGPKPDDSVWRPLAPTLDEHASPIALAITLAPGRKRLERSTESLLEAVHDATARVVTAGIPSLRFVTVTEEAKGTAAEQSLAAPRTGGTPGRGLSWGRAVHRALEALGRGRTGDSLRAFVGAVAVDELLDPAMTAELLPLIERTAASDAWKSLISAGLPRVELTVMRRTESAGVESVTEGVIDAAAIGPDGWRVLDWKTDLVEGAEWTERHERYSRQVDAYVELLVALTGQPGQGVVERVRAR
jgi:ATP-dependent helicase/nuclease subunit A